YFPLVIETEFVIVPNCYRGVGINVFTQNGVVVPFLFIHFTLESFNSFSCISGTLRASLFSYGEVRWINFPLIKSATFIIMSDKNVSSSVYILTYNGYFTIE